MIDDQNRLNSLEKSLNLSEEELKREKVLLEKAGAIYKRIEEFVNANKGDDDKEYDKAFIVLDDGRRIFFPFEKMNNQVRVWKYNLNEGVRSYGDSCDILPTTDCGLVCNVQIFISDKDVIRLTVSEKKTHNNHVITDEQFQLLDNYLTKLGLSLATMKYDHEATRADDNLTIKALVARNKQEFEDEVKKEFGDADPKTVILPSVAESVNWWVNAIKEPSNENGGLGDDFNYSVANATGALNFAPTAVTDMQLEIFRDILSRKMMEQLRHGLPARIDYSYTSRSYLHDALEEANISDARLPYRSSMTITPSRSVLSIAGFEKEIYNSKKDRRIML